MTPDQTKIEKVSLDTVWQMRQEIMYPNMSIDHVKLERDTEGLHYGIKYDKRFLSVISLFINGHDIQFRKFCTRTELQGKGYGTELLKFVFEKAKSTHHIQTIWCNARVNAVSLYQKFGMKRTATVFHKDGFDFVIMKLDLKT